MAAAQPRLKPDQVGDTVDEMLGALTAAQRQAYDQIRPEVPAIFDERATVRFLIAREWRADAALTMMKDHAVWRRQVGADTFLNDWKPPKVLEGYLPDGWHGVDNNGYPVLWDLFGALDPKTVLRAATKEDIVKYRSIYRGEMALRHMREESKKSGRRIDRCTTVLDLNGIAMDVLYKPFTNVVKEILAVFEKNYPETLRFCFIINAPRIFNLAWSLVKPLLPERTRDKVILLRNTTDLQNYMPAETIPKMFGGTAPDPGEPGSGINPPRGPVPPELFVTQNLPDDAQTVTVGRGSSHQHEVEVTQVGSVLQWEFTTADYDIAYGVFLKPADASGKVHKGDMVEIKANVRVDSFLIPETGTLAVEQAGVYVIRFDNTYSWTRAKKVNFWTAVLPPAPSGEQQLAVV